MSFLFPLYLAGLAALAIPVILHFRHRHTREKVPFSSLMFLSPTPIREKRRRRLENLLLLLLRCAVLALLALAFARPFFRQENPLAPPADGRTVAVLVDRSASMRRENLFERARAEVLRVVDELQPEDSLQLAAFGETVRILVPFEAWEEAPALAERRRLVETALAALEPGWERTRLAEAVAEAAEEAAGRHAFLGGNRTRELVLISDFQKGEGFETMEHHAWPRELRLRPVPLETERPGNVSLQLLPRESETELSGEPRPRRVRISADAEAEAGSIRLVWRSADGAALGEPAALSVVPGAARVAEAPPLPRDAGAAWLELEGDAQDFDNRWFISPPAESAYRLLFCGPDDPDSPEQNLFFLRRAVLDTPVFRPEMTERAPDQSLQDIPFESLDLAVVSGAPAADSLERLGAYLRGGGRVLYLLDEPGAAAGLGALAGAPGLTAEEIEPSDYAVIGACDRRHPLLQPFADARFGDFSRLYFWRYRKIDPAALPGASIIASLEAGPPLWLELRVGEGNLLVFTSGWGRRDGQLALSSKFIPLLYSVFLRGSGALSREPAFWVGDSLPLPGGEAAVVRRPDGAEERFAGDVPAYADTGLPGLYSVSAGAEERRYPVNLHPAESVLDPVEPAVLQRFLAGENADAGAGAGREEDKVRRILTPFDQEARQRIWWYLLVAALGLLLVEILYAARCHRRQQLQLTAQEG